MKNINVMRSKVATLANRLKKMGLTLSEAFRKAWELIKGKTIESKIAGVTIGNRQKALARLASNYTPSQITVQLIREPANIFDNNAVKVVICVNNGGGYDLGYLPRNMAYAVSAMLDRGFKLVASFKEVKGKYQRFMNYGAVINIALA